MVKYKLVKHVGNRYKFNYYVWGNLKDCGEVLIDLDHLETNGVLKLAPSDSERIYANQAILAAYKAIVSDKCIKEGTSSWM